MKKKLLTALIGLALLFQPLATMAALSTSLNSYYKLDESSGNASDSVSGDTLTNTNTVSYDAGLINNAADLGTANTNKSLTRTDGLGINYTNACALSLWVKMNTEITTGSEGVMEVGSAAGNTSILIYYDFNGGARRLRIGKEKNGAGFTNVADTIALGTTTWHNIIMSYDGTTITAYVDGTSVGTATVTGNGTASFVNKTQVGSALNMNTGATQDFISAKEDEIGVWTRALTSAEVTSIYNAGAGNQYPFGITPAWFLLYNNF